ncbi:MAG: AtpZ/AtpI family protein [Cyclobacteriaceae bacterium]|jgi:ATP synthase protein I|nr:AtpZ/AtpI family protein [Flammeovirgaceae bacterium]
MPKNPDNTFLKYSSLGLQLLATIGAAGWIGFQIDSYFGYRFPVFLLVFVVIAFSGMMYKMYRSLNE